jgi:hypothetical protein
MKTKFSNKVTTFEEALEFKEGILLCYRPYLTITLQQRVLKAKVWVTTEALIKCFESCYYYLCDELVMKSLVII